MRQAEINYIKHKAYTFNDQVRCQDVLNICGYTGKTRKVGSAIYFQCPNGCDEKASLDKCSINTSLNKCHCFGCGESFGPSKLGMKLLDLSFAEASMLIAYKLNGITKEEYEGCTSSAVVLNKLNNDSKTYELIEKKNAEENVEHHAPKNVVDLVYRHMLSLPEFRLTDEGIKYLQKRNISNEDILRGKFFSYSKGFNLDVLVSSIRREKKDFSYSDFVGVPGFFFEYTNVEKTRGRWHFINPNEKCLGIPLYDSSGRIVALQMRRLGNVNPKCSKYFFLSSRNIMNVEGKNYAFGSSPGSPVHVEYPETIKNPMILIGEGKFKMMEAAKEGSVSISVQGVGNYKYIINEIKDMFETDKFLEKLSYNTIEKFKDNIYFLIMYDADMYRNFSVLQAAKGLCELLMNKYPKARIGFLLWNEADGKGYDDLKENIGETFKAKTKVLSAKEFLSSVDSALKSADESFLKEHSVNEGEKIRTKQSYRKYLFDALWVNRISRLFIA